MDVGRWLRGLGVERYEATFRDNAIDADVLADLTDNVEKLGPPLGGRKRLLKAIARLAGVSVAASQCGPVQAPTS
jgi:SAM domain (Sterile alpha motif)